MGLSGLRRIESDFLPEWIADRQVAEFVAVMQIFGVKDGAPGFEGGGEHEGVVDVVAGGLSDLNSPIMNCRGERYRGLTKLPDNIEP
jgi:hypothetical protein